MNDLTVKLTNGESYTINRAALERESESLAIYHTEWRALVASNAGARLAREVMPPRPWTESGAREWDALNKQLATAIADELYTLNAAAADLIVSMSSGEQVTIARADLDLAYERINGYANAGGRAMIRYDEARRLAAQAMEPRPSDPIDLYAEFNPPLEWDYRRAELADAIQIELFGMMVKEPV